MAVLMSVFSNFRYYIPEHEFDDIANAALYKTQKFFDPAKGAKFTTLLCRNMNNCCKEYLVKNNNTSRFQLTYNETHEEPTREAVNMKDCVDSLPDYHKLVITQKYYQGMTLEEIGEANGYSRMTALRNVRAAEEAIKKLYLYD